MKGIICTSIKSWFQGAIEALKRSLLKCSKKSCWNTIPATESSSKSMYVLPFTKYRFAKNVDGSNNTGCNILWHFVHSQCFRKAFVLHPCFWLKQKKVCHVSITLLLLTLYTSNKVKCAWFSAIIVAPCPLWLNSVQQDSTNSAAAHVYIFGNTVLHVCKLTSSYSK